MKPQSAIPVLTLILMCALGSCTSSTSPGGGGAADPFLIAYYPLDSTPNDTLGKAGPMELTNAPFLNGGIYLNGVYINGVDTTNASHATTPTLDSLKFNAFTVTARFMIDEIKSPPVNGRPVIMGGRVTRWMGVTILPDTTLSFFYDNAARIATGIKCSLNTWHEVGMSYDSASHTGKAYLDGAVIATDTFTLMHSGSRVISTTNFSNGTAFLGYLADLKIYNSSDAATAARAYRRDPAW
jgi:hypothetical protein